MYQKKLYVFSLMAVIAMVAFLNQDAIEGFLSAETSESKQTQLAANVSKLTKKTTSKQVEVPSKTSHLKQVKHVRQPLITETSAYEKLSNAEKLRTLQKMLDIAPPEEKKIVQVLADKIRVLLVPRKQTTIASTSQGRITHFVGQLGQHFEQGDVLVSFDCNEKKANVDMAKAELFGAVEQHEAKMKMQGLDQASDVEVSMAASEANRARAQLKLNITRANECQIVAPWSGRVAKAHVKEYMIVAPGEPLLDIINVGRLKIKLNVPSKQLTSLKVGKTFNVTIDETSKQYRARISAINSQVDPVSQTVEVEAVLEKQYRHLLAGMSGTADLVVNPPQHQLAAK
jgi:RND family efflux transporter MFP subunit